MSFFCVFCVVVEDDIIHVVQTSRKEEGRQQFADDSF
jgi:hypothetical protein